MVCLPTVVRKSASWRKTTGRATTSLASLATMTISLASPTTMTTSLASPTTMMTSLASPTTTLKISSPDTANDSVFARHHSLVRISIGSLAVFSPRPHVHVSVRDIWLRQRLHIIKHGSTSIPMLAASRYIIYHRQYSHLPRFIPWGEASVNHSNIEFLVLESHDEVCEANRKNRKDEDDEGLQMSEMLRSVSNIQMRTTSTTFQKQ